MTLTTLIVSRHRGRVAKVADFIHSYVQCGFKPQTGHRWARRVSGAHSTVPYEGNNLSRGLKLNHNVNCL